MEYYNYIKALHLIFVITWFAGLFYIPRLFMYHIEALQEPSPKREILSAQLKLMTWRLWYIITWPSAILCSLFALCLLIIAPVWLQQTWMQVKLAFVLALFVYHLKTHQIFKELQQDKARYSANYMRIYNEVATIILFSCVFLAVLKNSVTWVFGLVGLVGLSVFIMLGIRLYKRIRDKNQK